MSECDISQCSTPNADKLSNEICDVDDPILNSIECCWDGFDCPAPTSAPTVSVRAPSSSFICVVSASCIEKITNDPKKEMDWLGDGFCDDWIDGFNTYECCFDDGDCLQTKRPSISPVPSIVPSVSTKPSISQEPTSNYKVEAPQRKSFLVAQYFLGAISSLILILSVGCFIQYYRKKHGMEDEPRSRHSRRPRSRAHGSSPSRADRITSIQRDTFDDDGVQPYQSNVSRWFDNFQTTEDYLISEHVNRQSHSIESCAICHEDFMAFDLVARLKSDRCCGTIFHHHCLSTWLNSNHDECPICRCSMFNLDMDSL